jgi:site-specific recombinase XerD
MLLGYSYVERKDKGIEINLFSYAEITIHTKIASNASIVLRHLRHAYGIKLAENGCAMHFISEVMGHPSVDYTRKQYASFNPESASEAVIGVLEGGRISTDLPLSAA